MPRTAIETLSNDAYVWVFGVSPSLDASKAEPFLARLDGFLDQWTAHGQPISSGRELRDGSFLVIAADTGSERSGCSIDRLYGTLQMLERELGVKILDPSRVFFRHGDGRIDATSRAGFRQDADLHTIVFDTTVERLGDIRSGAWERPAEQSWHKSLFTVSPLASTPGTQ